MCGLGFYRLFPLLRREATLMEMAIRAGDLQKLENPTIDMSDLWIIRANWFY